MPATPISATRAGASRPMPSAGIDFLGVGVSGGEEGARHGPSIMAGGKKEAWDRVADIFTAISAKFNGEPCAALVGPEGAGHFVKTIHNGIEYADMQMIAEVYGIMRDGLGMTPAEMAAVFAELERGAAQVLPHRDLREGARGDRPADRQAAGRRHPRQRRPEGHRPLVGDGGAGPRRAGDGDRGGGRGAEPLGAEGRARRRRGAVRRARARRSTAPSATRTRRSASSRRRCSPARSPPMPRAST